MNLNFQYVGSSYNGFAASTGISGAMADKQDSYQLGNLRLGLQTDSWQAAFYVDNLWDERPVLFFNRIVGDVRINTLRPRTIGTDIRLWF